MFTVAPMGRTKLDTSSETPSLSFTHSMVTGSVATLELVLKASICAGPIALKNPV